MLGEDKGWIIIKKKDGYNRVRIIYVVRGGKGGKDRVRYGTVWFELGLG